MADILLAEDDPHQAGIFTLWLEGAGHTVRAVTNGEDGLRLAALEGAPDLVVTDIMMPETDGESVAMVLGTLAPETPVVVVTGIRDTAVKRRLEASANVTAVLAKPVTHQDFLAAIADALDSDGPA